jgi:hypothetical protein
MKLRGSLNRENLKGMIMKLTLSRILSILSLLLLAAGCAHHRDVRPGADGIHKVIFKTEDKDEGYRNAMSQAEDFCKERHAKSPVILSEASQFTNNTMDEESYKGAKVATKVAKGVGGTIWALGGKTESQAGGLVGLGGAVADSVIGEGYTYELKFKCQ